MTCCAGSCPRSRNRCNAYRSGSNGAEKFNGSEYVPHPLHPRSEIRTRQAKRGHWCQAQATALHVKSRNRPKRAAWLGCTLLATFFKSSVSPSRPLHFPSHSLRLHRPRIPFPSQPRFPQLPQAIRYPSQGIPQIPIVHPPMHVPFFFLPHCPLKRSQCKNQTMQLG